VRKVTDVPTFNGRPMTSLGYVQEITHEDGTVEK